MKRVDVVKTHLMGSTEPCEGSSASSLERNDSSAAVPDLYDVDGGRNPATHYNGWGYSDTSFVLDMDKKRLYLSGGRFAETAGPADNRYLMNDFIRFAEDELGVDRSLIDRPDPPPPSEEILPRPVNPVSSTFLREIDGLSFTDSALARLRSSHGHTCQEVYAIRLTPHLVGRPECSWLPRLVDLVVYPESSEHVQKLIKAAEKHNLILVPKGGGTSVTRALSIDPERAQRSVVAVDMRRMKQILWVDRDNHLARVQAGITGAELERRLNRLGLTAGHEPDSIDFSTLGGWIATKASGMKRARYGNIEDIVVTLNLETCVGTLGETSGPFERASEGPSLVKNLAIGSEGTFGIVTDCIMKLRPNPTHRKYGSMLFRDFESGVGALRELARKGLLPASARLMDNTQFRLGQVLKPSPADSRPSSLKEALKSFYIETWNGFDMDTLAAATFVFEGYSAQQIAAQEAAVYRECKQFGGAVGDAENGKRGYFLTFMIAYLRDFGLKLNFLSESFEASVPWSQVSTLCRAVENKIRAVAKEGNIREPPMVGVRISQAYESVCCCYFYFGIVADDAAKQMSVFSKIEHEARQTIVDMGGSLSHHHGIGKAKKDWYPQTLTPAAFDLMHVTLKKSLDPKNVFGIGNLGF